MPGEWDWASAAPGAATGLQCCWAWGLGFSWAHGVTEQPDPSPGVGTHCWGARVLTEAGTLQAGLVPYRQQHQLELEAAHVPGAVLPELVEAELVRGRAQRTLTPSDKGVPGDRAPCSAAAVLPLSCTSPGCAAGPDQRPCPVFTYRRRLSGRGDVGSPSG